MSNELEEKFANQEQINLINELLTPRAKAIETELNKAIRVLKSRIGYLNAESKKRASESKSISTLHDLHRLAIDMIFFQNPYIKAIEPIPAIPVNSFMSKLEIWAGELRSYQAMIDGKISGRTFVEDEGYLYSTAIRNRLRRVRDDIWKLLSNFTSIEDLLFNNSEISFDEKLQLNDIPEQIESPIMTDIVDNSLIMVRGRKLQPAVSVGSTVDYLRKQTKVIMSNCSPWCAGCLAA